MTRLILVRHGQSLANQQILFAGHSDFDLSELGYKQARAAADYLLQNEKIDTIYASDLLRAYHTACAIGEAFGLPIIKDTGVREIFGGAWESMKFSDIAAQYAEEYAVWKNDYSHCRPIEGESTIEVYERVVPHICNLAKENDGKCILIATHACVIRAFDAYAQGFRADEVGNIPFTPNSSISIYTYDEGKTAIVRNNITDHLADMVTMMPPIVSA